MELTTPGGSTEEATEKRIVELVNGLDPNQPARLTLAASDDDWVLLEMTTHGLRLENKDAVSGLVLESTGTYISKPQAITVLKQYLARHPKWNMHADWAPKGGGGAVKSKKGGCFGVLLFFLASLSALLGMAFYR